MEQREATKDVVPELPLEDSTRSNTILVKIDNGYQSTYNDTQENFLWKYGGTNPVPG